MTDEKKVLNDVDLENVSGGTQGSFCELTVCRTEDGCAYLALRPQPYYDPYHELAQLSPGTNVFTDGSITSGTNRNGGYCQYRRVTYNNITGWANAGCLY